MTDGGFLTEGRRRLLVYALLLLASAPMLTKIFTSDYGTHLAIGRQIVQTMSVPDKEFLNYPSLGMHVPNGEWGFQALLWLVHSAGGDYGVSFMVWAVVFSIFLMLHRATVLRGANPFIAVAAIFAFSGFLRIRIQPRPEIFTYLFTAATVLLFSEYYFGSRRRLIYVFPVMVLVWANMHPTFLMAFILACAFTGERFVHALCKKELDAAFLKGKIAVPVALTALAALLCGINPHGWDSLLLPLHLISRGTSGGGAAGSDAVLMSISELTPVKDTGFFIYYKVAAWFAAATILLGVVGRRVYLLDLALFAIAFKGSWDSARAVSMMGLFLSPGAALQLTGFLESSGKWFSPASPARKPARPKESARPPREKAPPPPAPAPKAPPAIPGRGAVAALLLLCLAGFGAVVMSFSISQLEFGVGITRHKFSFKAAEFLRNLPIRGNMFNFFDIGGFLDWQLYPGKLTYIDGRTYNTEVFMEHQIGTAAMGGWEKSFEKRGITYAVLKTKDSSGMVLPIVGTLANRSDWQLIFSDGLFVVFARDIPENREIIQRYALPKHTAIPEQIIQEAYHYMFLGVSPVIGYATIANMYGMLGNRQAAIAALREGLARVSGDPRSAALLNERLYELQGGGQFR
jgi:hypothetical protein